METYIWDLSGGIIMLMTLRDDGWVGHCIFWHCSQQKTCLTKAQKKILENDQLNRNTWYYFYRGRKWQARNRWGKIYQLLLIWHFFDICSPHVKCTTQWILLIHHSVQMWHHMFVLQMATLTRMSVFFVWISGEFKIKYYFFLHISSQKYQIILAKELDLLMDGILFKITSIVHKRLGTDYV